MTDMPDPVTPPKRKRLSARGSKAKGDNYERELAAFLGNATALRIERAPLSGGGKVGMAGGADLIGTPGIFVEAKRTEALNVRAALRQALRNIGASGSNEAPVVVTRKNLEPTGDSIVVMKLDDWTVLYRAWLQSQGYIKD